MFDINRNDARDRPNLLVGQVNKADRMVTEAKDIECNARAEAVGDLKK